MTLLIFLALLKRFAKSHLKKKQIVDCFFQVVLGLIRLISVMLSRGPILRESTDDHTHGGNGRL